jgi:hypothetical protein
MVQEKARTGLWAMQKGSGGCRARLRMCVESVVWIGIELRTAKTARECEEATETTWATRGVMVAPHRSCGCRRGWHGQHDIGEIDSGMVVYDGAQERRSGGGVTAVKEGVRAVSRGATCAQTNASREVGHEVRARRESVLLPSSALASLCLPAYSHIFVVPFIQSLLNLHSAHSIHCTLFSPPSFLPQSFSPSTSLVGYF